MDWPGGICFRGSALEKGAWVMGRWGLSSHPAPKSNIPDPSTTTAHISPPFISNISPVITTTRHIRKARRIPSGTKCTFWIFRVVLSKSWILSSQSLRHLHR